MTELLFRDDAYLKTATARVVAANDGVVTLDRTIFYPLGGGQPGDTGFIIRDNGERIAVVDTRKGAEPGAVAHVLAAGSALPEAGEAVGLEIDWERRYSLMRLHTALHVMSCVVIAPVTGGNIAPDKARLDFDIDITLLDANRIADGTNELIARGVATETVWITDEELDARPELVKTMSVQPPRGAGRIRLLRIPTSTCNPAAARTSPTSPRSAEFRVTRIRNEGKRNKRVEIVLRN